MQFKATGEQPPRVANRNPNYAPHGVYPARAEEELGLDSWVAIAVQTDAEFAALCDLMGNGKLASDARFAALADRKANEDALDEIVASWTSGEDKWSLAERLQAAGIAAAPVEHLKDMLETDPQLPHHYHTVRQPAAPEVDMPIDREAARWVGHTLDPERAPMLGEHNQYVVQEILGRSDEDFVKLLTDNVLT